MQVILFVTAIYFIIKWMWIALSSCPVCQCDPCDCHPHNEVKV